MERIVLVLSGGTAVAQAQSGDPDLFGRPMAFHPEITLPPPPDRLYPGPPDSARLGIGGPSAFQSSKNEKDNSEPLKMPIGERRWKRGDRSAQDLVPGVCRGRRNYSSGRISERGEAIEVPRISCQEYIKVVKNVPQERISERSELSECLKTHAREVSRQSKVSLRSVVLNGGVNRARPSS